MESMLGSKSAISSDKILFIGIPGMPNSLSLNLEWPPGVDPELNQNIKGFFAPAKFLTDYKLIFVDPSMLQIHKPRHCFEVRRKELLRFFTEGGLLICIVRKVDNVRQFNSSDSAMNYEFINYNVPAPIGGSGDVFITDYGLRSPFADILKITKKFSLYYNEIKDFWGIRNDPCGYPVKITPLVADRTKAKVASFEATPLLKTNKTEPELKREGKSLSANQRIVSGFVWETLPGKMVFLPDYVLQNVNLLVECAKQELMRMGTAGFVPATWVNNYTFPGHESYVQKITGLKDQLTQLTQELETQEKAFVKLKETRDALLNGQGVSVLQYKAKEVFNELGISFEDGPEGRDDLVLKDETGKTILVCEVKGVSKSASEGDAAQLSKWRDRVHSQEGHFPKGLLLINAWREKDPKDRNEAAFPDQMMDFCNERKFCLMTTFQLFNIWCKFKRGELKENILKKIMDTNGKQLEGYDAPNANRIAE